MAKNDLYYYMKEATDEMQQEYERIQQRAVEDPGTAGDNGEENWANLLRLWLPKHYHVVTKGRIMNHEGECSPQVDILILSPFYPIGLLDKKEYLDGGVLAALECKLTLKSGHIKKVVQNSSKIGRMKYIAMKEGQRNTAGNDFHPRIIYGLLAHTHE
jgi:hypothetical protein